jgi:signal transduction histidine kinase
MLSQVVLNLLNNSQRFTEPGGRVTVGLRPDFRSGKAMLVVEDTGAGIPGEFLPYVFKPYMKKSRAGYGLGLAIVKRIVERCGWEIGIRSEEGRGTEITISGIDIVD